MTPWLFGAVHGVGEASCRADVDTTIPLGDVLIYTASRMLVESRDGSGANGSGGRPAAVSCSVL